MKILHPKFLRTGIITVVCIGVMAVMGLPVKASQPGRGVVKWLQSLAGNKPSPQLTRKLRSLGHSTTGVNEFFKQASKIISRNNKNFKFLYGETPSAIQQVLLVKWNQYKSGSAVNAILPVKPNNKYAIAPSSLKSLATESAKGLLPGSELNDFYCHPFLKAIFIRSSQRIIPLVNKISIGAP